MNEHLNSISLRHTEARSNSSEQVYAADAQRQRGSVQQGSAQQGSAQACQCGLDTGTRGWRYVYQTH